jgi:phosphatidylglycerol:prolipoprotein diacylglycerol transferase
LPQRPRNIQSQPIDGIEVSSFSAPHLATAMPPGPRAVVPLSYHEDPSRPPLANLLPLLLGYTPNVIPFLHLPFWPHEIPTYGLMVAIGMLAAYFVLRADLARRGIAAKDSGDAESLIAWPCLAGIAASKVYSILEAPSDFFADPKGVLFSQFGFTWIGGMLGGAAVFAWIAHRMIKRANSPNVTFLTFMDAGATAAALGYGLGRMGCLFAGDGDYGTPTSLPWGMSFPHGLVPTTDRVHPTPIYEFIAAVLIARLLWNMGRHSSATLAAINSLLPRSSAAASATLGDALASDSPEYVSVDDLPEAARDILKRPMHIYPPGSIFAAYLVLTGIARFLVEFIRLNPRVLWGLTNAQIVSLVFIVAGIALWFRQSRRLRPSTA